MSNDRSRETQRLLACAACSAVLVLPSPVTHAETGTAAPAAIEIAARLITGGGTFAANGDPQGALWARVPEAEIELKLAPPVHPSIASLQHTAAPDTALPLHVGALTDGHRLYLRLRWKDRSHDNRRAAGLFPDAAAIEVPIGADETAVMMGMPDKPVAIWRWDAATNDVEALAAGSPGTLTPAIDSGLAGTGVYRQRDDAANNEWCVVIAQDLDATGDAHPDLRERKRFAAAFAVWQGSDRQRGGFKRVSEWVSVRLPE